MAILGWENNRGGYYIQKLFSLIGNLSQLITENKGDLVSAINSLLQYDSSTETISVGNEGE